MDGKTLQQKNAITQLEKRAEALTRVFTWSTDSDGDDKYSSTYTFTEGVSGWGHALLLSSDKTLTYLMGFVLEEGPACTMYLKF